MKNNIVGSFSLLYLCQKKKEWKHMGRYAVVITEINSQTMQFLKYTFAFKGRAGNFKAHI
jgi:hypothetical protein